MNRDHTRYNTVDRKKKQVKKRYSQFDLFPSATNKESLKKWKKLSMVEKEGEGKFSESRPNKLDICQSVVYMEKKYSPAPEGGEYHRGEIILNYGALKSC